jgi:hypothetical protein
VANERSIGIHEFNFVWGRSARSTMEARRKALRPHLQGGSPLCES